MRISIQVTIIDELVKSLTLLDVAYKRLFTSMTIINLKAENSW